MADINRTTYFYRLKFKSKEAEFNKPAQLPEYFSFMMEGKDDIKIAELGAGPINTIGDSFPGKNIEIFASDIFAVEYWKFWWHHNKVPIVPVKYEDMEHLSYPDEFFDIVHCRNAIDHTPDIYQAIKEMKRVCKKGGWIYFAHAPGQKKRYGGMHHWNMEEVDLRSTEGFSYEEKDGLIINTWRKI